MPKLRQAGSHSLLPSRYWGRHSTFLPLTAVSGEGRCVTILKTAAKETIEVATAQTSGLSKGPWTPYEIYTT